jgi:serine/threonine protein kinase
MHNTDILHGDIHPQNLLIDECGEAAIIDFDQSERHPSKGGMKREYAELVRILESPGIV